MFERLKSLYEQGKIGETQLNNAVIKGWLTEAQKTEIIGQA